MFGSLWLFHSPISGCFAYVVFVVSSPYFMVIIIILKTIIFKLFLFGGVKCVIVIVDGIEDVVIAVKGGIDEKA